MKHLLFIINPNAGKSAIRNDLFDIIQIFQSGGYEVVTYFTTGPDDAERKVIADGGAYDLIVCAGGDGTLNNTIRGYMSMGEKKTPIGYIPVGTTNDFAKSLNISFKPVEAAQQIMRGEDTGIDVGSFAEKNFIYIAAFGVFTDISYSTKQSLKKAIGHSAYIVEAVRNFMNYKPFTMRATFDDKVISGDYIYGMVTNSLSVAGFKIRGTKHVVFDDGKFDCMFIRMPTTVEEMQKAITGMLTNNITDDDIFFRTKAAHVKIESEQVIPWTIDGEFGGDYESVEIVNHQKAVSLRIDREAAPGNLGIDPDAEVIEPIFTDEENQ